MFGIENHNSQGVSFLYCMIVACYVRNLGLWNVLDFFDFLDFTLFDFFQKKLSCRFWACKCHLGLEVVC